MAFDFKKLTKQDYLTTTWSGGTTTQLAIFPLDAKYAERDFLWRVSSAAVNLEESDFTDLPDYERLIAALEGEMVLTHNGGEPIRLRPFQVHAFSGAEATHSRGRCTDFNLMLRRGRAEGNMEALQLTEQPLELASREGETLLLHCAAGRALACQSSVPASRAGHPEPSAAEPKDSFSNLTLAPGETLLLTGEGALTLTGPARLLLCRIRTI